MLEYFILFSLVLAGAVTVWYFSIKWGAACDCSCHDENLTFKCDDSCECLCHGDHIYKYRIKVVEYFRNLYNKIRKK